MLTVEWIHPREGEHIVEQPDIHAAMRTYDAAISFGAEVALICEDREPLFYDEVLRRARL